MTRVDRLEAVFVEEVPEVLEDGILFDHARWKAIAVAFHRQSRLRLRVPLHHQGWTHSLGGEDVPGRH
ncbi:hypothetical protein SAMN02927924_04576 [Sphingobium faniae]|nr:hypothetical protein SAMN02927924_04576 [Sphingobium faniae]